MLGRYRIVRLIGQGAMGRVLLAYDPVLDREVAVKYLRDDLQIPPEVREGLVVRMRHEARAAARVMHPHLVTLHDMGEDPDLGLYLVFEYVEGPTLKQRLAEGPLSAAQGARLARELGAALTVAHSAGIVHRDIKPENIILAKTGGKLADFGIARIPDSTLTHAGGLMGTPAYSAPETFRAGAFSAESDQFSLAASIYEALSGTRAFPGDDAIAVAARIANDPPARFAPALGLTPYAYDVLARALDKRPEERFPSCEAFGVALEQSLQRPLVTVEIARTDHLDGLDREEQDALAIVPPPERKTSHVVMGAAAVVVTTVLLGRAIIRDVEKDATPTPPDPPAPASVSAPVSSSSGARPRSAPPPKSVRPKSTAEPQGELPTGAASPGGEEDGGSEHEPEPPDAGSDASVAATGSAKPAPSPTSVPTTAPSAGLPAAGSR